MAAREDYGHARLLSGGVVVDYSTLVAARKDYGHARVELVSSAESSDLRGRAHTHTDQCMSETPWGLVRHKTMQQQCVY